MIDHSTWCVYIVQCADGSFYTGISTDVTRRLRQHNGELCGGAKYTSARRPCVLVYRQYCVDRSTASRLEYKIRRFPRRQKLALIMANPA